MKPVVSVNIGNSIVKLSRQWSGKKSPTNPEKKDAHQQRKHKRIILLNIKDDEYEKEILEYKNANQPF